MPRPAGKIISAAASVALLCMGSVSVAHAAYYAKTISSTTIYSLQADTADGPISSSVFWRGGTALKSIAIYGNYAFVSDNASIQDPDDPEQLYSGPILRVFQLGSGLMGNIKLQDSTGFGVQTAGPIAVDGAGHVYVADTSQSTSSKFACVYAPDWTQPNTATAISYGSVAGNWMIDVAGYSAGAVMLQRYDILGGTSACHIVGNVAAGTQLILSGTNQPIAVTTNTADSDTYFVSDALAFDGSKKFTVMGRAFDWTTLGTNKSFSGWANDMAFVYGGPEAASNLAIVGVSGDSLQVWKLGLTDGAPDATIIQTTIANDASASHNCAASEDGQMLWVTSQSGRTVYGLAFGSLTTGILTPASVNLGDDVLGIVTHKMSAIFSKPVGMNNRSLLTDPKVVGMLVVVWGRVLSIDGATSFVISDGYDATGITVMTSGVPLPPDFDTTKIARVTGLVSADKTVRAEAIETVPY